MYTNSNKILRFKAVVEEYKKHKKPEIPDTIIFRNFIYPKFFISMRTYNTILSTPIEVYLKELELDFNKLSTIREAKKTEINQLKDNFYITPLRDFIKQFNSQKS